jgi:hypothetical protein
VILEYGRLGALPTTLKLSGRAIAPVRRKCVCEVADNKRPAVRPCALRNPPVNQIESTHRWLN